MSREIEVLLPIPVNRQHTAPLTPRPADLKGLAVGLLWNTKPNADLLFDEFTEQAGRSGRLGEVRRYRKQTASSGAPAELLDQIAAECGAAVVALGD